MHFSPARWTTAIAAATLIALPGAALAQSNPPQNPPAQPPAQTQPQTQSQTPPQTSPQTQTSPQPQSTAANGQIDPAAAKQHLTEARDALSQITSMPEASKLQGDARTKVSELISNFNALITTPTDWRASYAKVNDSLTALLGPDTAENQPQGQSPSQSQPQSATAGTTGTAGAGTAGAGTTGTAGTSTAGTAGTTGTGNAPDAANASGTQLDPAIRAKLVEFRTHLKEFEKAAGGSQPPSAPAPESPASAPSSAATAPSAATGSATNPSNPATAGTAGTSGSEQTKPEPTGTTGTSPATAPSSSAAAAPSGSPDQNSNAAAQSELAAIDAILAKSKAGTLTKTQTAELRRHVEALRALLTQK